MIRVLIPYPLQSLAGCAPELMLDLAAPVTIGGILTAIEKRHPMLVGTIRDQTSGQRRPFVRYFACEQDLSHESPETEVPEEVSAGKEPFIILGAIAGG